MSFPDTIFGCCEYCGGCGGDYETVSSADATPRDTVGNGFKLEVFRGRAICPTCKQTILNEEESLRHAEHARETDKFLSRIGFKRSVE